MKRIPPAACVLLSLLVAPAVGAQPPGRPSRPEDALKAPLARPVIKAPLARALAELERQAGVRIAVDWAVVKATGVDEKTPISVDVPQATASQMLELILAQAAAKGHTLGWYLHEGTVRVTTQARALYWRSRPAEPAGIKRPRMGAGALREVDFDNIPVENVLTFLRDVTDLNFHVNWRSLQQVNVDRSTPVTLKATAISTARALTLITDQLSTGQSKLDRVYWVVDEGVVMIATGAALNTGLKTKVIDIADLLLIVPNFQGPRIETETMGGKSRDSGVSGGGAGWGGGGLGGTGIFGPGPGQEKKEEEDPLEMRRRVKEDLVAVIKDSIGEDMWTPQGPGSIRILGDKLIISQTILGFKLLEESSMAR